MFPTREQVVEHIHGHARDAGLELLLGTRVERLSRGHGSWTVETRKGEIDARQVVVATGYENEPLVPDWDGRESFAEERIHSAEYRNADRFRSRRVLVVGPGCSGMEIAHDLATGWAAKVWLAVRTPPTIISRAGPGRLPGDWIGTAMLYFPTRFRNASARFGSRQDFGDLSEYGLPVSEEGLMTRLRRDGTAPSIVDKEVIAAVKEGDGRDRRSGRVARLRGGHPRRRKPCRARRDHVRHRLPPRPRATGRPHLGVLDDRGRPAVAAPKPAAPGLRFVGYTVRPDALGFMSRQAKRSAKAIALELQSPR